MTQTVDVAPLVAGDAPAALRALRARGLRISTARRLIVESLYRERTPISVAHIADGLSLDESSVYRNLEVLERQGLVRHLHLGHGPGLYVLAGEPRAEYLYCERCGRVTVAAPGELDAVRRQIGDRFGFAAQFTHFAIVGVCADCAAATAA